MDWAFQLMLEENDRERWLFRRDHRVTLSFTELVLHSRNGLPYLRPEVQLLYKAQPEPRQKDEQDFEALLPVLSTQQRKWLADALALTAPGHPWWDRVSST